MHAIGFPVIAIPSLIIMIATLMYIFRSIRILANLTLEDVMNTLMIYGTPAQVADKVHAFKEVTGDFGTLMYAGVVWKDPVLARNSMILMAEKVVPLL
jgi:alkanesulfonate monooxygenase SsuD/methylene tetrahydromethanopterin reductase-like flavin-dependent oxidoreductase (luciferase family)